MSLYRYKGSKVWTMDFMFQSQRIRESTGTRSKTLAKEIERKRRHGLEEGAAGIRKQSRAVLFSVAAADYLEMKRSSWSPRMYIIENVNLGHLLPQFGKQLVCDIDGRDVTRYQQNRLKGGAAPKTINLEFGKDIAPGDESKKMFTRCQEVKRLGVRSRLGKNKSY